MFKHLFICALLGGFAQLSLHAQSSILSGTRLVDENSNIRVAGVTMLGTKDGPQGPALFYSFVHPRGGIQQVRTGLMTGGRDPEPLLAIGAANLSPTGVPSSSVLRWAAAAGANHRVNYLPNPLTDVFAAGNEPLATSGQILSNDTLRTVLSSQRLTDTIYLNTRRPEKEPAAYGPGYFMTYVNYGLSGRISSVSSHAYVLREESERGGLLSGRYKRVSDASFDKENYVSAFESENMGFKLSSGIPVVNDPLTGNAVAFGSLKYRKDDSKENSEYYEFKFLAFNKEGELFSNVLYTSPEPVQMAAHYMLYGNELAPDITAINYVVYILRGDGAKGMEGVNRRFVRALVFDIKTGQLVSQSDTTFKQGGGLLVHERQLPDGNLELTYLYNAPSAQKGISVVVISPQGIVSMTDYFGESSIGEPLQLKSMLTTSLSLRSIQHIPQEDGSEAVLQMIARKDYNAETKTTSYQALGYGLSIYEPNGYLRAFIPLNRDISLGEDKTRLMYASSDRLVFIASEQAPGVNRVSLLEVNLSNYAVSLHELPEGYTMSSVNDIYLNREQKRFYLLAQPTLGKGLYLFHYFL